MKENYISINTLCKKLEFFISLLRNKGGNVAYVYMRIWIVILYIILYSIIIN